MPEVEIRRHRDAPGIPWWAWVTLGVGVMGMIGWFGSAESRRAGLPPVERVAGYREATPYHEMPAREAMEFPPLPLADVLSAPGNFIGTDVQGAATVSNIEGPGFWVEEGGRRLFVVQEPSLALPPPELQAGDRVFLRGALNHPTRYVAPNLDPTLKQTLGQQPILLFASSIMRIGGSTSEPTPPASTGTGATTPPPSTQPGYTIPPGLSAPSLSTAPATPSGGAQSNTETGFGMGPGTGMGASPGGGTRPGAGGQSPAGTAIGGQMQPGR